MRTSILRQPAVSITSGNPRSTLYKHISEGLWTKPIRISQRAVGWPASEVEALNAARIAGRTDAEIRTLVAELEAARKTIG